MRKIMQSGLLFFLILLLCSCGVKQQIYVPDANGDGKLTCTLEVRCDTILDHLDEIKEEKAALVPGNGQLLAQIETEFEAGESAFDVFRRVLREEKIHYEYVDSRIYNSVYIEGIGNLYEFDCGPQSGWMYSVNGEYPGLGCSAYTLSDGDNILFSYTCDLGEDLGAEFENEE